MDYDENSLNSMPTVAGGMERSSEPQGPISLGSAPTMAGRTAPLRGRLRPGDSLLGRYTVLAELGEGGMGVVYKCLDTVGGIEVAVKCLPPELSRNEAEMEGIRENYAIVARLHHSAISGLRQLEKDPDFGEYYLVMDLAKGEDLAAILRRRRGAPMPPDEALAILRPIASALDYAHGEHVLHRDVKPANVMVETLVAGKSHTETQRHKEGGATSSSEPHVQLLDFGLAAEVRSSMSRVSLRGHAGSSGTPAYMAPEQWEARRQSAATDQYSLAVMAYQMLSGALPFDADGQDLLRRAVLSRPPDPVAELPRAANAALLRALAKDPADRFPSCQAFVEALARGLGGAGASGSRRVWPWAAALVAALAVGAALWRSGGTGAAGATGEKDFAPRSSAPSVAAVQETPGKPAPPDSQEPPAESTPPVEPVPETPDDPTHQEILESPALPEPPAPALPPEGASLEDLQAARDRFADALEARRAEGWPDDSGESAPLAELIATLDGRITSALKEREEQERQSERERIEKRASDARAVAAIGRLKAAAVREVQGVKKFRKWNDGEFKTQFALLDRQKAALDSFSEASDLAKAKEAAADIHSAAVWIADNAEAREGLDAIEKAIDAFSPELEKAEAQRYAQSALYAANTARKEAVRRRDRSDFTGAKEKFEEAKRLFDGALAEARRTQVSARAREAVGEAEAAKIREEWETVIAKANAALALDADNADAKSLKAEAEAKLAAIKAEKERKTKEEAKRRAKEEAERKAEEDAHVKAKRDLRIVCEKENLSSEVKAQIFDYVQLAIAKLDMTKSSNRLIKENFESDSKINVTGLDTPSIAVISNMGIAPTMSVDATGMLNLVYGKPNMDIIDINMKTMNLYGQTTEEMIDDGVETDVLEIRLRVVPFDNNSIVATANPDYVHIYGAKTMSEWHEVPVIDYDWSRYLQDITMGEFMAYVAASNKVSFLKGEFDLPSTESTDRLDEVRENLHGLIRSQAGE